MRGCLAATCSRLLGLAGCQSVINPYDARLEPPVPESIAPGRELSKVSLPAYRIEPPDVINLEMLKLVPLPPYRAEVFDVLQIRANAPLDQPIDNYYMIEAEGTVNLGPQYGQVRVAGMTIEEIRGELDKWLHQYLTDPNPSVQRGPRFRAPAGDGAISRRPRRHDQPAAVRRGARSPARR